MPGFLRDRQNDLRDAAACSRVVTSADLLPPTLSSPRTAMDIRLMLVYGSELPALPSPPCPCPRTFDGVYACESWFRAWQGIVQMGDFELVWFGLVKKLSSSQLRLRAETSTASPTNRQYPCSGKWTGTLAPVPARSGSSVLSGHQSWLHGHDSSTQPNVGQRQHTIVQFIKLCRKLNPFCCSSHALDPTAILAANVWPSPGTSWSPHLTPFSTSAACKSLLNARGTMTSSVPCTINVGGNDALMFLSGSTASQSPLG